MRERIVGGLAALVLLPLLACDPADPEVLAIRDDAITVASFDFEESAVIAELYVGALIAAGLDARHLPRIGSREMVLPALERGLIEVLPEYSGSAIEFLGGRPTASPATANESLRALLEPKGIHVLPAARAQSRNGLVVASATAAELSLRAVSDLRGFASQMTLGGPPECPDRDLCLSGFTDVYGLTFAAFLPLDAGGPLTAEAIERGTVDVGVLFTSDGSLAENDLRLLKDDRRLQPAENITPLVHADTVARFGPQMIDTLRSVSSELTTEELRILNAAVRAGTPPAVVAARWLSEHGLGATPE